MLRGEVGKAGVSIFIGVTWNSFSTASRSAKINTSMTINATAPFLLALYLVTAEKHGVPWERIARNDPE